MTHFCSLCFLGCANWETLVADNTLSSVGRALISIGHARFVLHSLPVTKDHLILTIEPG